MTARTGLAWVAGAFAVTLVAAVACGSSTAPSPAATPVPSVAPETIAAPSAGESMARAIAAPHLTGDQTEIVIAMLLDGGHGPIEAAYDQGAAEVAGHLEAGRDVAALCEGDPFFYGSFMYLFARMAERFPVEVVPGVSSLTACAAVLGSPLAARNDTLTVVPATLEESDLNSRLQGSEAAAIST